MSKTIEQAEAALASTEAAYLNVYVVEVSGRQRVDKALFETGLLPITAINGVPATSAGSG